MVTVRLRVTDLGGLTHIDSASIDVNNVAPVVSAGPDATFSGTFNGTGSFIDPGPDSWTATVDYGDGSGVQPLALNPDKTFQLSHSYVGAGPFTITVIVEDDDNEMGTDSLVVTPVTATTRVELLGANLVILSLIHI